jgi:hypothetical protein
MSVNTPLSHSQLTLSAEQHCPLHQKGYAMSLQHFEAYVLIMFWLSFYMSSIDGSVMIFYGLLWLTKAIFFNEHQNYVQAIQHQNSRVPFNKIFMRIQVIWYITLHHHVLPNGHFQGFRGPRRLLSR